MTRKQRVAGTTLLALSLGALGVAASAATLAMAIVDRAALPGLDSADPSSIAIAGLIVVGVLVAWRQPRNPCGWLLLGAGIVVALMGLQDQYARLALVAHHGTLPGGVWSLWLASWFWALVFPAGAVPMLILLVPDGRLLSRRWRPVVAVAVIDAVVLAVVGMIAGGPLQSGASGSPPLIGPNNPIGVLDPNSVGPAIVNLFWFGGLLVFLTAAASLVVRLRRSRGVVERQQVKWIAYALIATALVAAPVNALSPGLLPNWAPDVVNGLGFGVALPVSIGFAIFKHNLYDIDVVVSRTLVYGALAALITGVYVGIAVGLGALVGSGGKPNLGLSILATAIVAIGFQPVRERLQKVANRLVYGKRATPYEVLSAFSRRVAESYAGDEVLPRMAQVLQEGTAAEAATIWLRSGEQLRPMATSPDTVVGYEPMPMADGTLPDFPAMTHGIPVRHQGNLLGALSILKRRGDALTPIEQKLVDDLAHQAGLVLKNVGLTADLQSRLDELRASRQRLVAAQDGERRRIERNLHDGAQQHLVALKVNLAIAEMQAVKDPEKAKRSLAELKGNVDEALETLRDLARGIYPPLLAESGLRAALEAQARKATLPVNVDARDVGRFSQELEAALYFCALEALQNVQKYAGATVATLQLRGGDGEVSVTISDDGAGFDIDSVQRGAGLTNMEDRLEAVGGSLRIRSAPGSGTTVIASVPAVMRSAEEHSATGPAALTTLHTADAPA